MRYFTLPSLVYHNREWFVFPNVLSHLPKEKADQAEVRANVEKRFTSRLGIRRDWVMGDRLEKLMSKSFIPQDEELGNKLIFSNVLIVRENFQDLLFKCFNRRLTFKVEQYTLTEELFTTAMFEWRFDPSLKENNITTNEIETGNQIIEQPDKQLTVQVTVEGKEEVINSRSKGRLKRRRPASSRKSDSLDSESCGSESDQSVASVSGKICLRQKRKKTEDASNLISLMSGNESAEKGDTHTDNSKDIKNEIKEGNSLSPRSSQKELTLSIKKDEACGDEVPVMKSDDIEIPATPPLFNGLLQEGTSDGDLEQTVSADYKNDINDNHEMPEFLSDQPMLGDNSLTPDSSPCHGESAQSSITMPNDGDSDMLNSSQTNDTAEDLIANIKEQEKQLLNESEMSCGSASPTCQETSSSSINEINADENNISNNGEQDTSAHDNHNVTNCENSSLVCACKDPKENGETPKELNSSGASELLDGLIASGFVSTVRQLLENSSSDKSTKMSQIDEDLKVSRKKLSEQKKNNNQMELNIKRKAKELERLFGKLKEGKALYEDLERKCKTLEQEKAAVDAKVKKCLEVLNSID